MQSALRPIQYDLATPQPKSRPLSLGPGQTTLDEEEEVRMQAALGSALSAAVDQTYSLNIQQPLPVQQSAGPNTILSSIGDFLGNTVARTTVSCALATAVVGSLGKVGSIAGRMVLGDYVRAHYPSVM